LHQITTFVVGAYWNRTMINLSYLVVVATLAGTAGLSPTSPAAAHSTCTAYGANVACVGRNHHMIFWCDHEADRHRVFAQYSIGESAVVTTGVVNGSRSGCGHMSDVSEIVRFRVCEIGSGCSAWKRA
jgi:hypothetical protein